MFLKFKGKLSSVTVGHSKEGTFRMFTTELFTFSKRKIYFDVTDGKTFRQEMGNKMNIHYGDKYTLIKITPDDFWEWSKNQKFQVEINDQRSALVINRWNGILLRIIHERYWIQKNSDWFFKAVITTIIGAAIGLLARQIGYNEGIKAGSKAEKANTHETHQPK